jgi:hypothetical protein
MAQITLQSTDQLTNSRADINSNFTQVFPNVSASSDPSATDDVTNHPDGKLWLNTAKRQAHILLDGTDSAALWAPIGGPQVMGYLSGQSYLPPYPGYGVTAANNSISTTVLYFMAPFYLRQRITIADLWTRIGTAGSTSLQLALYANATATNRPTGNPVAKTGNIVTTGTGNISGATVGGNVTLDPGWYWPASMFGDTSCRPVNLSNTNINSSVNVGTATKNEVWPANNQCSIWVTVTGQTFGTWPDLSAASWTYDQLPRGAIVCFTLA